MEATLKNKKTGLSDIYVAEETEFELRLNCVGDPVEFYEDDYNAINLTFPAKLFKKTDLKSIKCADENWSVVLDGLVVALEYQGGDIREETFKIPLTGLKSTTKSPGQGEVKVELIIDEELDDSFGVKLHVKEREQGDKNLPDWLDFEITPVTIETGEDGVEFDLEFDNLGKKTLVTKAVPSAKPQIEVSFYYGEQPGALTTAGPTADDVNSARHITVETKTNPKNYPWSHSARTTGAEPPKWIFKPAATNQKLLGSSSSPNSIVSFTFKNVRILKPGSTHIYITWSGIPGFAPGEKILKLRKKLPAPGVLELDTPEKVAWKEKFEIPYKARRVKKMILVWEDEGKNRQLETTKAEGVFKIDGIKGKKKKNIDFTLKAFNEEGSQIRPFERRKIEVQFPELKITNFSISPSIALSRKINLTDPRTKQVTQTIQGISIRDGIDLEFNWDVNHPELVDHYKLGPAGIVRIDGENTPPIRSQATLSRVYKQARAFNLEAVSFAGERVKSKTVKLQLAEPCEGKMEIHSNRGGGPDVCENWRGKKAVIMPINGGVVLRGSGMKNCKKVVFKENGVELKKIGAGYYSLQSSEGTVAAEFHGKSGDITQVSGGNWSNYVTIDPYLKGWRYISNEIKNAGASFNFELTFPNGGAVPRLRIRGTANAKAIDHSIDLTSDNVKGKSQGRPCSGFWTPERMSLYPCWDPPRSGRGGPKPKPVPPLEFTVPKSNLTIGLEWRQGRFYSPGTPNRKPLDLDWFLQFRHKTGNGEWSPFSPMRAAKWTTHPNR